MLQAERRNYIIESLKKHKSVKVENLAQELNTSHMTIRRDLKYLEENQLLTRTHGGAVLENRLIEEIPYHQKSCEHMKEKERIAEHAMNFIENGATILLDAGTTSMEIAKRMIYMKNIRVITTDLAIALLLSKFEQIEVYCVGGKIQSITGSCIGPDTKEFLEKIHADVAFIGTSAIDLKKGLTTPDIDKGRIKKQMINSSEKAILVTDHYKFFKKSFSKICDIKDLDTIITDHGLEEDVVENIKALGVQVDLV